MPMMNSEARKRVASLEAATEQGAEHLSLVARLADLWDEKAEREEARGNGFAAVILHSHAEELRAALETPRSA